MTTPYEQYRDLVYGPTIDKLKQRTVPVEQLLMEQEQRKNWLFEKFGTSAKQPAKT